MGSLWPIMCFEVVSMFAGEAVGCAALASGGDSRITAKLQTSVEETAIYPLPFYPLHADVHLDTTVKQSADSNRAAGDEYLVVYVGE